MPFLSNKLLSWHEPVLYARKKRTQIPWVEILAIMGITLICQGRMIPILILYSFVILLPWIYFCWPALAQRASARVTLYNDRLDRQFNRDGGSIALKNIARCRVFSKTERDGNYYILSLTPKKNWSLTTMLTETAVADPVLMQHLLAHLRDQGIPVTESSSGA